MKYRSHKWIKVVAINLFVLLWMVAPVLAMEPISPPIEGALITNNTYVTVIGNFTEEENFSQDLNSGTTVEVTVDDIIICESPLDEGKVRYEDEIRGIGGTTTIAKGFTSNSSPNGGNPNVEVDRTIGFTGTAASIVGYLYSEEKGGVSVYQLSQPFSFAECVQDGLVCIVAHTQGWDAAAGSRLDVSSVSAHSETDLTITNTLSVHHSIDAQGIGEVQAGIIFIQGDGGLPLGPDCDQLPCRVGSSQMVTFSEDSTARGTFTFNKDMYVSAVEAGVPVAPWLSGLTNLTPLCPW